MKLLLTTRLSPSSLGSVVYARTPVASKNIDTGQCKVDAPATDQHKNSIGVFDRRLAHPIVRIAVPGQVVPAFGGPEPHAQPGVISGIWPSVSYNDRKSDKNVWSCSLCVLCVC